MNSPDPAVILDVRPAVPQAGASAYSEENAAARFEMLVRENQTAVFRVAYRLTGDRDEAEDLVQEALVEAFRAFNRFRPGTHFDRWVFRIMRNTFLDGQRRTERARFDAVDGVTASRKGRELGVSPFSAD